MQSIAVFVAILAVASANTIAYRVPSADSAVINSQRVGGNFAYSTSESAAYGVVSPVVQQVATPVATTYTVQQPTVQVQGVQNVLPVQQQVATYGVNYAYGLPLTYTAATGVQANVVQVEQDKQIAEVRSAVQQPAVQYQQVQQVQPQQIQVVQPQQVQQIQVQQPLVQQVQQVATPVATTYSVQQPQTTWVQQQQVASGWPVTTYAVQAPTSVVQAGTPASTYKTLNGVSPLGVNYAYGYGYGLPVNTVNVNTVV